MAELKKNSIKKKRLLGSHNIQLCHENKQVEKPEIDVYFFPNFNCLDKYGMMSVMR